MNKVYLTVQSEKVIDGRRLCNKQDFFRIKSIERALGGTFGTIHESIADFMESCEEFVREFVARVHGIKTDFICRGT